MDHSSLRPVFDSQVFALDPLLLLVYPGGDFSSLPNAHWPYGAMVMKRASLARIRPVTSQYVYLNTMQGRISNRWRHGNVSFNDRSPYIARRPASSRSSPTPRRTCMSRSSATRSTPASATTSLPPTRPPRSKKPVSLAWKTR